MALIALRNIRCIDYLAYGTIFTRGDVSSEKKVDVYFPARKAADERWGVVGGTQTRRFLTGATTYLTTKG